MKNGTICLPMAPFVVLVVLSGQFSNHFLGDLKILVSEDLVTLNRKQLLRYVLVFWHPIEQHIIFSMHFVN